MGKEILNQTKDIIWHVLQIQVTLLVYRDGDQLHFFRVVDRGDGTLTPFSESFRFVTFAL